MQSWLISKEGPEKKNTPLNDNIFHRKLQHVAWTSLTACILVFCTDTAASKPSFLTFLVYVPTIYFNTSSNTLIFINNVQLMIAKRQCSLRFACHLHGQVHTTLTNSWRVSVKRQEVFSSAFLGTLLPLQKCVMSASQRTTGRAWRPRHYRLAEPFVLACRGAEGGRTSSNNTLAAFWCVQQLAQSTFPKQLPIPSTCVRQNQEHKNHIQCFFFVSFAVLNFHYKSIN